MNLVYSSVFRPQTSLGDIEKNSTVELKAAAFFHSLVKNHPFFNGNKRTARVSLLVFLDQNERRIEATDDELFEFVMQVATDTITPDSESRDADATVFRISCWLRDHTHAGTTVVSTMRITDFLKRCKQAGANCEWKKKGGHWLVKGPNRESIRISGSTQQLDGPVVKRYVQKLGLSDGNDGLYIDEFQTGVASEQRLIRRFRNVLRRLSHA